MIDLLIHMFFATKGLALILVIPLTFMLSGLIGALQGLCDLITKLETRKPGPRPRVQRP